MPGRVGAILGGVLIAATAACGGSPSSRATGPAGSGRQVQATSDADKRAPECGHNVVAGEADNGSIVCVAMGGDLIVMLPGSGSTWSDPQVAGDALGPGRGVPTPAGVAGWSFEAVARGTAEITMSRHNCPTTPPGSAGCLALTVFRLRVLAR